MKKHSLKVSLSETRSRGSVKRTAKFDDKEIWWDISGDDSILPPRLTVHDIAATGLVFFAMHHGKHLHVEGPVSASLLENLEDLVVSWVNRRPDLYQRINISAAKEVRTLDEPSSPVIGNQAVAAFSGGLDASFTAWRHVSGKVGRRNKKLIAGVLIHGFDIPIDAHQAFETTCKTAAESLRSLGVSLAVIKTNWRAQIAVNWNLEFGAGVSTCLRHWQGTGKTVSPSSRVLMDYPGLIEILFFSNLHGTRGSIETYLPVICRLTGRIVVFTDNPVFSALVDAIEGNHRP